tara:strand:- start:174 stop:530 length:357 start_codon:yes stop_codon:yes gene_type:complete
MRLTKRQLKRIIREEYSRLKRRGLINEMGMVGDGMSMHRGEMCDGAEEVIANAEKAFNEGWDSGLMNHWKEALKPFGSPALRWLISLENKLASNDWGGFEDLFMTGACEQVWCDALYG